MHRMGEVGLWSQLISCGRCALAFHRNRFHRCSASLSSRLHSVPLTRTYVPSICLQFDVIPSKLFWPLLLSLSHLCLLSRPRHLAASRPSSTKRHATHTYTYTYTLTLCHTHSCPLGAWPFRHPWLPTTLSCLRDGRCCRHEPRPTAPSTQQRRSAILVQVRPPPPPPPPSLSFPSFLFPRPSPPYTPDPPSPPPPLIPLLALLVTRAKPRYLIAGANRPHLLGRHAAAVSHWCGVPARVHCVHVRKRVR